jgi:hypothetical protein
MREVIPVEATEPDSEVIVAGRERCGSGNPVQSDEKGAGAYESAEDRSQAVTFSRFIIKHLGDTPGKAEIENDSHLHEARRALYFRIDSGRQEGFESHVRLPLQWVHRQQSPDDRAQAQLLGGRRISFSRRDPQMLQVRADDSLDPGLRSSARGKSGTRRLIASSYPLISVRILTRSARSAERTASS